MSGPVGPRVELLEPPIDDPVRHAALGPAMLDRIGDAAPGTEWIRFYVTGPTVGFTGRDRLAPRFADAVATARKQGFAAVRRGPGGRAAAYHGGALCIDHVGTFTGAARDIEARFARFARVVATALSGLGVPAQVGELPGEYCPGAFSVHDGAGHKLAGSAQRLTSRGWLFSTVLLVEEPDPLRGVLTAVCPLIGVELDPRTVGAVCDTTPGVGVAQVRNALRAGLGIDADQALPTAVHDTATARLERHRLV